MAVDADRRAVAAAADRLRSALGTAALSVWTAAPRACVAAVGAGAPAADDEVVAIHDGPDTVGELRWCRGSSGLGTAAAAPLVAAVTALLAPVLARLAELDVVDPAAAAPFGLVGGSAAMTALHRAIPRAGAAPFPVLIEGESGVGKELVARALHAASRRTGAFVAVNAAALADDLIDAELFGHARGAFTGAAAERRGLFEAAHGGTLFLDEVAELSARGQAKLLRVLQEGELRRLGENAARRVDVRVIAATNRPLDAEVVAGRFRADLRFRLDVVRLRVPPLRDRRDDIPALAEHFWRAAVAQTGSRARLAPSLVAALCAREWPGNARELQNAMAALAVSAPPRGLVRVDDLAAAGAAPVASPPASLDAARRAFDAAYVHAALARSGQRPSAAARELGLTRQGLTKLMDRLGLRPATAKAPLRRAM